MPVPRLGWRGRWFGPFFVVLEVRVVELVEQPHQVALQHCHGHLSHHGHVHDARNCKKGVLVDVFVARHVDDRRVGGDPFRGETVLLRGDARDDHRRLRAPHNKVRTIGANVATQVDVAVVPSERKTRG